MSRGVPSIPPRPSLHQDMAVAHHSTDTTSHGDMKALPVSRLLVFLLLCVVVLLAVLLAYNIRSFNQVSNISDSTQALKQQGDSITSPTSALCVCADSVAAHQPAEPFQLEPSPRLSSTDQEYVPVFDFNVWHPGFANTSWGFTHPANLDNWPALQGVAISQNLFQLEIEGSNSPHHHPDAVEMLFVIQGVINVTRIEPNGGTVFSHVLHANMSVFFPRGHIHFQHNVGNSVARYISTLNAELPGVMSEAQRLCELPYDALLSMFALSTADSVTQLCGNHDEPGLPPNIIHYIHGVYA